MKRIVLAVLLAVVLFQLVWLVSTSLQRNATLTTFPPAIIPMDPTLDNYRVLHIPTLIRWVFNSVFISAVGAVIGVVVAAWAGWALSRMRGRLAWLIVAVIVVAAIIPDQVIIVPRFLLVANTLGLYDKLWAGAVPGMFFPFGVFLVRQYCIGVPQEYTDAAAIDGAGLWTMFWRIIWPMIGPVLAVVFILDFTAIWGDVLWQSVIFQSVENLTVPVGLMLIGAGDTNLMGQIGYKAVAAIGVQPAAAVFLGVPSCCLFMFLQKYVNESEGGWYA